MKLYGLLGRKLGHSFSQRLFEEKFKREHIDARYELFEVERAGDVAGFLQSHSHLSGLNVTVPYKRTVIPSLSSLSPEAEAIGAVNVIKFHDDGSMSGHNTDCIGFREALLPFLRPDIRGALVLGTGGASRAVCHALRMLHIEPLLVSRMPKAGQIAYSDIDAPLLESHPLIVNTTPLGMWPDMDSAPDIPYQLLSPRNVAFDLVYNPEETLFMKLCREHGAAVSNGLEMLIGQARAAWEIWNA